LGRPILGVAAILIMAKYKREGICPEERKELMWMIF